jgi:DNA modification methylase
MMGSTSVLPKHIPDESVDLIYIDPPFNSSRNYEVFWGEAQERRAFEDRFGDAMTYLEWMRPRLRELYRVLKPTGSFYYHCDWHASHYVKVELDRIVGFNNFQNEIVWSYKRYTAVSGAFQRMHDVLLFYRKANEATFNTIRDPYGNKSGKADSHYRMDDNGRWYRWQKRKGQEPYKVYLSEGRRLGDVWEIPHINASAKERLGYPTQKPLALVERVIQASSNEGDLVLDAFCGCGTTLEAAAKLNRKWVGIDFSPTACRVMAQRLEDRLGLKEGQDFQLRDMPKTPEQLRRIPHFEFENWAVLALGGIPNKVKVGDYGIDGRLYLADVTKEHRGDFFETLDRWYPIQVKQIDHVGRPDIDKFETAMRRDKRVKGYFVAFGFSGGAIKEVQRANTQDGLDIVPVTVAEILRHELAVVAAP